MFRANVRRWATSVTHWTSLYLSNSRCALRSRSTSGSIGHFGDWWVASGSVCSRSKPNGQLQSSRVAAWHALRWSGSRIGFRLLQSRFGRVTLAPLRIMSDTEAEAMLLQLPGVGKKVARCVLLYSLHRDVFPVDTHCFRVLKRLGLVPQHLAYRQAHDALQSAVPKPARRSLHVNLIRHGRAVCTAHHPQCPACPLLQCCPTGKHRVVETNAMSPA